MKRTQCGLILLLWQEKKTNKQNKKAQYQRKVHWASAMRDTKGFVDFSILPSVNFILLLSSSHSLIWSLIVGGITGVWEENKLHWFPRQLIWFSARNVENVWKVPSPFSSLKHLVKLTTTSPTLPSQWEEWVHSSNVPDLNYLPRQIVFQNII